ncbi:MAG TPA: VTT domain-containing protein [candidate division Zixibacteria bacterium]|nr:VTT domain-containing protein [candidate division Zixibacteria bacterium]
MLFLLWRWTPLAAWIDPAAIAAWQESIRNDPAAAYVVVGAYVLASLAFVPATALTLATVMTFGPIAGNLYALAGWLVSAAVAFTIGRLAGREVLEGFTAPRLKSVIRHAARRGFLTVLVLRLLPVAPFTLVNLFVGAAGIRFADFFGASLLGRIPGWLALTFASVQLEAAFASGDPGPWVLLGLLAVVLPPAAAFVGRRLGLEDRLAPDRGSGGDTHP